MDAASRRRAETRVVRWMCRLCGVKVTGSVEIDAIITVVQWYVKLIWTCFKKGRLWLGDKCIHCEIEAVRARGQRKLIECGYRERLLVLTNMRWRCYWLQKWHAYATDAVVGHQQYRQRRAYVAVCSHCWINWGWYGGRPGIALSIKLVKLFSFYLLIPSLSFLLFQILHLSVWNVIQDRQTPV